LEEVFDEFARKHELMKTGNPVGRPGTKQPAQTGYTVPQGGEESVGEEFSTEARHLGQEPQNHGVTGTRCGSSTAAPSTTTQMTQSAVSAAKMRKARKRRGFPLLQNALRGLHMRISIVGGRNGADQLSLQDP
jgi:hypothetical protein